MVQILANLNDESLWFLLAAIGLVVFFAIDRLAHGADIGVAVLAIDGKGAAANTYTSRLLLAAVAPTNGSPDAMALGIDDVTERLSVALPTIGRRYARMTDAALSTCLQCLPLLGLGLSLLALMRQESLTAGPILLAPTLTGVAASVACATLLSIAYMIDLPSRLIAAMARHALVVTPGGKTPNALNERAEIPVRKKRSFWSSLFRLHAHSAPVMLPMVFAVAYADWTQSMWLLTGRRGGADSSAKVIDNSSNRDEETPFLEACLLRHKTSVMGDPLDLDMEVTATDFVLARVVEGRFAQLRPRKRIVVAIKEGSRSCPELNNLKSRLTRSITTILKRYSYTDVEIEFNDIPVREDAGQSALER